ncbi:hypothetical protein [Cupriavidus agavae]|uniref:Uncharacterized protein n=1 Tax=Cupriavidus agavae TaxID=1001822 RepID=A0A4Q7R7T8_9BURK|nr:hypothetical protein [Cupriavidus agavae]RZT28875.1 hypothetical protein EV147_5192 [Cupriavidus agavae]
MFSHLLAGARAAGLALLAATLLVACGSDESPQNTTVTPTASRLVVDTGSAAPVAGGTLTLKATLLAADGSEVKGASFAWMSSNPAVATVVSASDKAPAATASVMARVGIYATIQTLVAGVADITATATLADGSQATSTTHLSVQPPAAKTYALSLSPSTLTVNSGAAPHVVTAVVQRSDGVDGVADLKDWSWTVDNSAFAMAPASDGHSAQVSSSGTLAATGKLTACATTPAGDHLCANTSLARPAVPLPSIAFSALSLRVKPGRTGTVSATLTDAQGANLASQATLGWSIQQSGTAASIVGAANSASVTVGIDAAQTIAYTATLTVTATYPDGRSNSSSLPLSSPGMWSRLPDAPIASPSIISLAIDGTRVWRLTADGSQPARLERFGTDGATPREPVAALPAAAQGIWLAAATNPVNSSVMVQLSADAGTVSFGSLDADLAGSRADGPLQGCGTAPTAGRTFIKSTDGTSIYSVGWCANSWQWWNQQVGGAAVAAFQFETNAPVLDARPVPTGGAGLAIHNDGLNQIQTTSGSGTAYTNRTTATLSLAAIAPNATDESSPVYGYASSLGIVTRPVPVNYSYVNLWSGVPLLTKLSAIPHFLVGLSASSLTLFNTDNSATATVAFPSGGTVIDFVGALDTNGKVRIAAKLADGSVWVYDQP